MTPHDGAADAGLDGSTAVDARETERSGGPPRWLVVLIALVAIGALAFAIGRFSTFGRTAESSPPRTDSAEAGFARDMQLHHEQAVSMGMTIYDSTQDTEVRTLAYDIVTVQSEQRGEMYSWLVSWGLPQSGGPSMQWMSGTEHAHGGTSDEPLTDDEARLAMGMATDAQLAELAAATGTAADCLFLDLMTTHHLGAIEMVDAVLDLGTDARTLEVAQKMKDGQQFELDSMASMQARLGCTG